MRLLVSFIIIVLVSVYMSCTVGKTINTSRCNCVLNPETLEVTGTDYDFKDSIYYGCRGMPTIVMELLTEELGHRTITASKNYIKLGYYGLGLCPKVKYCKDTTEAKQLILKEIMQKWPYEIQDTIKEVVTILVSVTDSTRLPKPDPPGDYFWSSTSGFNDKYSYVRHRPWHAAAAEISPLIINSDDFRKKTEIHWADGSYFERPGTYTVYVPKDMYYAGRPTEEVRQYLRDSLGMDFTVVKREKTKFRYLVFK